MSEIPPWFERRFDFTFPATQYPNLCVRLRGTPARLEEMLHNVPQNVRIGKGGGKWSAQEHAGHLLDLESLWMTRFDDFLGSGDTLTLADLSNRKTHLAEHTQRPVTEILANFREARFGLLHRLSESDAALFGSTKLHPRLKQPLRLVDHLYFVAEHDDHHLASMWELIQARDLLSVR